MDDVEQPQAASRRPAANLEAQSGRKLYYVGDTVDDARCARAAKVPFIGIAAPANPRYIDLVFLFQEEGAYAIIDDINYLRGGLRRMRTRHHPAQYQGDADLRHA